MKDTIIMGTQLPPERAHDGAAQAEPSPCGVARRTAAYGLEASTWLALDGHIPGHPLHDPHAWATWRRALHAASDASLEDQRPSPREPATHASQN